MSPRAECRPGHPALGHKVPPDIPPYCRLFPLVQTVPLSAECPPRLSCAREQLHWTIVPEMDPMRILKCQKGRTGQFEVSVAVWKTIYETMMKYG